MHFRPDPAAMTGTYDTSDTAGPDARFGRVEDTSSVFDIARAGDLQWALRSMDPGDTDVPFNLVQTSPGLTVNRGDPDDDKRRIAEAAQRNLRHLVGHGFHLGSDGLPVRDASSFHQPWKNQAQGLGPAVSIDHPPTGAAG
jgi:hypothetical protein